MSTSAGRQRRALLGDDDANMVFETSKEVTVVATFDQMNLREELLRGIYAYGEPPSWGAIVVRSLSVIACVKVLKSHQQSSRERFNRL